MRDQKTDDENRSGKGPNMTISTTSKSPKTTGEGTAWRDTSDNSICDNNGHYPRVKSVKRNAG